MIRATGIVRVSRVKGREGESFVSPKDQADRITKWCEAQGIELDGIHEELDVSGAAQIIDRTGLTAAIESIEAGQVSVLVVAYLDRLVRDLNILHQITDRVESAGGRIFALDMGQVSNATHGEWLHGSFRGLMAEYQRRQIAERIASAQVQAVARGAAPFPRIPPGYRAGDNGVLEIVPDDAETVREAFRMRESGKTIEQIRTFLQTKGIIRSYHGTSSMLSSRIYLGEIKFGKLFNPAAHEPLIDPGLFRRVQKAIVPRGPRPASTRLLARLGVARCGTCDSRMVVATSNSNYWVYRCPPTGDCERHVAISAEILEKAVIEKVKAETAGMEGRASKETDAGRLGAELDQAQGDLDAAIRAFDGMETEPAAIQRLQELRTIRDGIRDQLDHLALLPSHDFAVSTDADWDALTLDEQRTIIKAIVPRVRVTPGRTDRIHFG